MEFTFYCYVENLVVHEQIWKVSLSFFSINLVWKFQLKISKSPENNGLGNISPEFCFDKSLLCASNGLIFKILKTFGIYHVIDACLSLEIAFKFAFVVANTFGATKITWVIGILCSFAAVLISCFIIFEILKFLGWVLFFKVIFCDFHFTSESQNSKSNSKRSKKQNKREIQSDRKRKTDFKRLKNIISSPTSTSTTVLPQFQTKSLKDLESLL